MNSIDKNDVNISKLFRWGDEFKILDSSGNELLTVFIRLVGDAEINRARVFALRKSAEIRKKLKDEESDEYFAYIPDKELLEKDTLVEAVILYMTKDVTLDVFNEVRLPLPVEPESDASLEKQEKHQQEIDDYPKRREGLVRERVIEILNSRREELKSRDIDYLYNEFKKLLINKICEDEMLDSFKEMCVYFGSYKDSEYKEQLFKDFDEFDNLPQNIKGQFLDYYATLELSGEDLKKLREAMQ
jgi:hypothetical protein